MTKVLKLALMGRMQLSQDDRPLTGLVSAKAQALLCYLAVNGRSHSRLSLAALLWDEMSEADARRNLRGVLMKLRHSVGPYLTITHQTVAFNRESNYWLDVAEFKRGVAASRQQPATSHPPPVTSRQLKSAISLYRGDFLEAFHVRQAPQFEEWVAQQRTELHEMVLNAYQTLTAQQIAAGEYEQAIASARRLLNLDPAREEGHRQLMRLLALTGQRSAALSQYATCRQILADELDVEPVPATAALYEAIKSGEWQRDRVTGWQGGKVAGWQGGKVANSDTHVTPSPGHRVALSPSSFIAGPPIIHPRHFFGRQREIKRIFNLLKRLPLQNTAIIGDRRSGKTSLLHYLKTITATPPQELRPGQRHDWLPQPARYRWIFVDFQDPRLGQCDGLLRYLLQQMQLPDADVCDIDYFLDVVSETLHSPTVILFDEIGVALERYSELNDAFWESLRSLATNQVGGNLAFILSAHESPAALAQHSGLGSPFFNIFGYTARLGPLTEPEARQLIAASPIPFPPADVAWMLAESGRWPMPLQILCRERLAAVEDGEEGDGWREDALRQMAPFAGGRMKAEG